MQTHQVNPSLDPQPGKAARYKWKMSYEPGSLVMLDKNKINIDQRYQRALNDKKRLEIASAFNWVAFGALSVIRRADGTYWGVDGQHRLFGALSRDDVTVVPCVVFDIPSDIEEEAAAFLSLNTLRKPLSSREKFKAQLVKGDPVATEAWTLIQQAGRSLDSASVGGSIDCLTALMAIIKEDVNNARTVWPLIAELCEGKRIDNRLVSGMALLERKLVTDNEERVSLLDRSNKIKLLEAGVERILKSIHEASAFYHRGGQLVFARGILTVINYRRQRRLRIKGQESGE
jgi:hypothetical protein